MVDEHHERSLRLARAALSENDTLGAVLEALFQAKFGRLLGSDAGHPPSVELVDATHRLTGPATRAADEVFHALVVTTLSRHGRAEDADDVADTLVAAAKGLMRRRRGARVQGGVRCARATPDRLGRDLTV